MNIKQFIQNIMLAVYDFFKQRGWLEKEWFKRLFWQVYFFYKKHFEDPFYGLTQQYPQLFKGGNIVDIGANIGYTAVIFSQVVSPGFKIYAFEPDRSNFLSLREIIRRHKAESKIVAIEAAMGENQGKINLWHNEKHHGDHRILTPTYEKSRVGSDRVSEVPMWSVDSFIKQEIEGNAVKFIKIDVQGYELAVCLGMMETLATNPDAVVAVEYAPSAMTELGFSPEAILHFFAERNYFAYLLEKGGKLQAANLEKISKLVGKRGYIDLVFGRSQQLGELQGIRK